MQHRRSSTGAQLPSAASQWGSAGGFALALRVGSTVDGSEPLHRCAGLRAPECGDGSQAALCSAQEYGTQCSTEGVAQEPKV